MAQVDIDDAVSAAYTIQTLLRCLGRLAEEVNKIGTHEPAIVQPIIAADLERIAQDMFSLIGLANDQAGLVTKVDEAEAVAA